MPQDAVTLRYAAKELSAALAGGKINKITQPVKDEIDLTVYAGGKTRQLALSANASFCRAAFSDLARENPLTCPSFCMLLRKHLLGGTVEKVEQCGSDRVIAFTVSNRNDLKDETKKVLYAEIMGKYSNLILTENGVILGAIKTASLDEAKKRPVMTGFFYAPPPSQEKADLTDENALLAVLSAYSGSDPGEYLFSRVKGFSYATATEAGAFLEKSGTLGDPKSAYTALLAFLAPASPRPCVLYQGEKPVDFFLFPYETLAGKYKFFPDLLAAENAFYTQKESTGMLVEGRKRLENAVKQHENRLKRRLASIAAKERDCADLETLKKKGEILTANLWQIPAGADHVVLPDYYEAEGATVKIALDPTLSPSENAKRIFKRYDKAKKTLIAVAPQRAETEAELGYVESVYEEIDRTETYKELAEIEAELISAGILKPQNGKKRQEASTRPLHFIKDGFSVFVGRNNLQNDALTSSAKGGDIWLHTKDYHSSHVIVETQGKAVPDAVLVFAAEVCAYYSKARNAGKVPVDHTLKKHVKKPSGAKPGFVIYTDQKTLFVSADPHADHRV